MGREGGREEGEQMRARLTERREIHVTGEEGLKCMGGMRGNSNRKMMKRPATP